MLFILVFLYSLCTLFGGLVTNYYLFVLLRFLVGLGLSAELGVGLVLICEVGYIYYQGVHFLFKNTVKIINCIFLEKYKTT